jgi:hypothetical protein
MGAKFSGAEVEAVDLARGDTSRSEWAAYGGPGCGWPACRRTRPGR